MKMKNEELTGVALQKAVSKAIVKSYAELSSKLESMSIDQLTAYLAKEVVACRISRGLDLSNAESIRSVILELHETEPASDAQEWGLCEVLRRTWCAPAAAADGVPVRVPSALSVKPAGRLPDASVQLAPVPLYAGSPDTVSNGLKLYEYASPTKPFGSVAAAILTAMFSVTI